MLLISFRRATATHFRGRVYDWDVVNEAFVDDGSYRNSVFYRVFGPSYIPLSFQYAANADPYANLYYNDYSIEAINPKSNAVYILAQQLIAQNIPIHGVGFQSHFIVGQVPPDFAANLQRFANLGLDVAITELDIRITVPPSQANLNQQALDYAASFNACFAVPRCVGVTIWGVSDLYSWVPDFFPGEGAALIHDENYNRKLAYYAIDEIIH